MKPSAHRDTLETQIAEWRDHLRRRAIDAAAVDELEGQLRDQIVILAKAGLSEDEAFLVAVKRLGSLDELSREFARERSEGLWKQLVVGPDIADPSGKITRGEALVVLGLAGASALAIKVPALFGFHLDSEPAFYWRNASLFVLPFLTLYFVWKRSLTAVTTAWLALAFAAAALFANIYPFATNGDTQALTAMHLPIALWLVVGIAYAGGRWFTSGRRMDFVRFSGELTIYYVLIALGGTVLTAFIMMMFGAIGVDPTGFIGRWLIPCGAVGAVIIAAGLVEAKQSVIGNIVPVLARLFTPLFTAMLLVFLGTLLWSGGWMGIQRDMLIAFDLLLVLVVGLVLYAVSARDPLAPPDFFDALQLLLVTSALAVDAVMLTAIAARISEFGFTANRVAALGENLILLVNLAGIAWLYAGFIRGRKPFAALEQWQMSYLAVYALWAAFVVVVFPPLFGYR
jgi:hypothetical protein